MTKTILVTGSTDGIGFETAKALVEFGHHVIVHGRNPAKVESVVQQLSALNTDSTIDSIVADLSKLSAVRDAIATLTQRLDKLDVLINNAGVFHTPSVKTADDLDVRFAVNTIAPYMLTCDLMPLLGQSGRVVNLSSAAQASFNVDSVQSYVGLGDSDAYAQSKLALTMWSHALGDSQKEDGPMIVAVNPKSFLGSKMVKEAYGVAGNDIKEGSDILVRAALSDEFAHAHGLYYDNDIAQFTKPHRDALDAKKAEQLITAMHKMIDIYA